MGMDCIRTNKKNQDVYGRAGSLKPLISSLGEMNIVPRCGSEEHLEKLKMDIIPRNMMRREE